MESSAAWVSIVLTYVAIAGAGFLILPAFLGPERFQKLLDAMEATEIGLRDRLLRPTAPLFQALGVSPNAISLAGIGLTALLGYLFFRGAATPWLFAVAASAALSDMFDGSLARLTNRVTKSGGFLDGFRDFLLFIVLTVGLLWQGTLSWTIFLWFGIGSLVILALKGLQILAAMRTASFGTAFTKKISGQSKLEIDRLKAFFYFAGLVLLLAGSAAPIFIPVGNFLLVVAIVSVAMSALIHGMVVRFSFQAHSRA